MNYVIYMHISPSNKRYIGITSMKIEYRWNNGRGYRKNKHFYRAIEKYGWENFEHIIIARGLDNETAKWLEIELIREWNTTDTSKGYNISLGGDIPNKETIKKISENHADVKGENNPMYGKDWREGKTEEELKEIKRKQFENTPRGKNHPMYGKKRPQETTEKILKTKRNNGTLSTNARKVICITTKKCFDTITGASTFYNCDKSSITKCCKGKKKSCGKLPNGTKLVWMYLDDYLKGVGE